MASGEWRVGDIDRAPFLAAGGRRWAPRDDPWKTLIQTRVNQSFGGVQWQWSGFAAAVLRILPMRADHEVAECSGFGDCLSEELEARSASRAHRASHQQRPRASGVAVGTALSGCPPDRTRRADFPHRAPTSGQRAAKRVSGHGWVIAGFGSGKRASCAALVVRPSCTLTPPLQGSKPRPPDALSNLRERSVVGGHAVVTAVPAQHAAEPPMLVAG